MNNLLKSIAAAVLCFSFICSAADQDEAMAAAKEILSSIQQKKLDTLWNNQTSGFFKSKITKESFFANLTMSSQQLGASGASTFIDMAYSQYDPASGLKGEIYAFNFLNSYSVGNFYERIVVIKEQDGKFRLSGLWGAPAPQEPQEPQE